jgi:hypothetical protein
MAESSSTVAGHMASTAKPRTTAITCADRPDLTMLTP